MAFRPDHGETLLTDEERDALTPEVRDLLGDSILKADLYDLEQQIQDEVADELVASVLYGTISAADLLADHFVRELHRRLYAAVWTWGGRQRSRETNIGVAPERIAEELRNVLDDLRYRWEHGTDLTPRLLGIAAHSAVVHVHPFVDGNGRVTRLLADLLFLAAQDDEPLFGYDWNVDRQTYIRMLGEYDRTFNAQYLSEFIGLVELKEDK